MFIWWIELYLCCLKALSNGICSLNAGVDRLSMPAKCISVQRQGGGLQNPACSYSCLSPVDLYAGEQDSGG